MLSEKIKEELIRNLQEYLKLYDELQHIGWEALDKANDAADKAEQDYINSLSPDEKDKYLKGEFPPDVFTDEEIDEMAKCEYPDYITEDSWEDKFVFPSLFASNEHINKYERFQQLALNINNLLVEAKISPILGLTEQEMELLKKSVHVDNAVNDVQINSIFSIKYIENKDDAERDGRVERLREITPLITNFFIDPKTLLFYRQVLQCYVYGYFEASCVLARAIIENIAKDYIKHQGYEDRIVDNKRKKEVSIPGLLHLLKVNEQVMMFYKRITGKADNILHKKDSALKSDVLDTIKMLQRFILLFPKRL